MNARKVLWMAAAALLLAGCKDPSERFEGPGGSRLQPVVHGGTRFADDELAIPIEAMASDEAAEPRIIQVELYSDGVKLSAPPQLRVQRWKGKFGYGQIASFVAPPSARSLEAVLFVRHLSGIFEMDVPFVLDPDSRETNKWIMKKETVREVGTARTERSKPRADGP
jgi:hypothetical protein